MKILKSGVDMTPKELREIRGGHNCICGCEGVPSARVYSNSESGDSCHCYCLTSMSVGADSGFSATTYPV